MESFNNYLFVNCVFLFLPRMEIVTSKQTNERTNDRTTTTKNLESCHTAVFSVASVRFRGLDWCVVLCCFFSLIFCFHSIIAIEYVDAFH